MTPSSVTLRRAVHPNAGLELRPEIVRGSTAGLRRSGADVAGRMLRMRQEITTEPGDRDVKDQYFTLADGAGEAWLAHRYAYVRRP